MRLRSLFRLFLFPWLLALSLNLQAQTNTDTAKPYATLDRGSVSYRGPIRPTQGDANGDPVIGMILPLTGAQQAEGGALLAAAQIAVEEENAVGGFPSGKLNLVVRDENGPWGQASMEILKLYDQDHALAILTSANGTSAHLAEQIANKISIPILTLASDPSTTQANVPWLFRLGASDEDQARAFCQRIYRDFSFTNVLLIVQTDHDGRVGAAAFEKVAPAYQAAPPQRFEWTDPGSQPESLREILRASSPEAIVVWSDVAAADSLIPLLQAELPTTPVFLCRKAAEFHARRASPGEQFAIESSAGKDSAGSKFQQAYLARTGANPSTAAYEFARGVHAIAEGLRANGANRVLLRDYLAHEGRSGDRDDSHAAEFDAAGNDLQPFAVVKLEPAKP
jgi:ABC-type branched-subunit amino acid transport system substrate-binding protein